MRIVWGGDFFYKLEVFGDGKFFDLFLYIKYGNLLKSLLMFVSFWLFDFLRYGVVFSGYSIWYFSYVWY